MITAANAPHLANACALMVVVEVEIVTHAKELHSWKVHFPMLVTDAGMPRLVNELHTSKAPSSMLVTEVGMSTLVNELH